MMYLHYDERIKQPVLTLHRDRLKSMERLKTEYENVLPPLAQLSRLSQQLSGDLHRLKQLFHKCVHLFLL